MFKNKSSKGTNNICGRKIKLLREQIVPKVSQREFADMVQLEGLDLDKNAIQRIECGKRFVTDIELKIFARVLKTTTDNLLSAVPEESEPQSPEVPSGTFRDCKQSPRSRTSPDFGSLPEQKTDQES